MTRYADVNAMTLDELRQEVQRLRAQVGVVKCPHCGDLVQRENHYCGYGYWGWRCPQCEKSWIDDSWLDHTHELFVEA